MKKIITVILAMMLCLFLMAGCCLSHDWVEADCVTPKTCAKCEKTEGEALGHDWTDADCVAPKTCSRCDETEGEALGHDWADADCVSPKNCTRCDETEGEALGHTYTGWVATQNETMTNTCTTCSVMEEKPIDREFIGRQQLVGKWLLESATVNGNWFNLSLGWTIEFHEDGTFVFVTSSEDSGEIEYVEFYSGDQMELYVFDGNAAEGAYSFNYEPAEDAVYVIGSEYFRFVRVVE